MKSNFKYGLFSALAFGCLLIGLLIAFFFVTSLGRLVEFYWCFPFLILAYIFFKKSLPKDGPPEDDMDYLTVVGKEIKIRLSDCTILENDEALETYKKHGLTPYYDEGVFDKIWGKKQGIENPLCIVYLYSERVLPSSLLYISKENLQAKLSEKQETSIYLHPKKKYYYFDLEFLLD